MWARTFRSSVNCIFYVRDFRYGGPEHVAVRATRYSGRQRRRSFTAGSLHAGPPHTRHRRAIRTPAVHCAVPRRAAAAAAERRSRRPRRPRPTTVPIGRMKKIITNEIAATPPRETAGGRHDGARSGRARAYGLASSCRSQPARRRPRHVRPPPPTQTFAGTLDLRFTERAQHPQLC